MAARLSWRRALAAAALGTQPFLLITLGDIATTRGGYIDIGPRQAVVLTLIFSLVLWLGSTAILTVSGAIAKSSGWLFAILSVLVFAGVATLVEPASWNHLSEVLEGGPAAWIFPGGVLATLCALLLRPKARLGAPAEVAGGPQPPGGNPS